MALTQPGPALPTGGQHQIGTRPRPHHQQHCTTLPEPTGEHPLPGRCRLPHWPAAQQRSCRHRPSGSTTPARHRVPVPARQRPGPDRSRTRRPPAGRPRHPDNGRPGIRRPGQQGEEQAGGPLTTHTDHRSASQPTPRQHSGQRRGDRQQLTGAIDGTEALRCAHERRCRRLGGILRHGADSMTQFVQDLVPIGIRRQRKALCRCRVVRSDLPARHRRRRLPRGQENCRRTCVRV